jgi:hypothetical protein
VGLIFLFFGSIWTVWTSPNLLHIKKPDHRCLSHLKSIISYLLNRLQDFSGLPSYLVTCMPPLMFHMHATLNVSQDPGALVVIRVEDTDQARSTRASEEAMIRDLKWLGLSWDEGMQHLQESTLPYL